MGPGDIPGWNSLGMIELFAEIERIYKTSIPLGDMADIESISDLHSILERNGLELER
jgi:acyl carrier protein